MFVVEPIYTKRIDINQRLKDYNLKQKEDGLGLGTNQRKKRGRSIWQEYNISSLFSIRQQSCLEISSGKSEQNINRCWVIRHHKVLVRTHNAKLLLLHTNYFLVVVKKQLNLTEAKSTLVKEINALCKLENCCHQTISSERGKHWSRKSMLLSRLFPTSKFNQREAAISGDEICQWLANNDNNIKWGDASNIFTPRLSTVEWLAVARDVAQPRVLPHRTAKWQSCVIYIYLSKNV